MIFPFLSGLRDFASAPLTWSLVFLNLIFYFLTLDARVATDPSQFFEVRNMQRTGVYYRQYLNEKELPGAGELVLWGGKALRDPGFMQALEKFPFQGDSLEVRMWREDMLRFRDEAKHRPTTLFGLSRDPAVALQKPLTWITYQFMHAGAMHLISNMMFLLIFGIAIERRMGSAAVMGVYLLGGIIGAGFALWSDAPSALPMVGASASISALIAFYLLTEERRNIRYFYFFSPFRGFYGEVFLSKWWILPLCLLSDFVIWSLDVSGHGAILLGDSVATSAHVGGALLGVLAWMAVPLWASKSKLSSSF